MQARLEKAFACRRAEFAVAALLVAVAVLCHGRYLFTPGLLFATEGDSFRQILPTSILYQNALAAGQPFWSWSFGLGGDLFSELSYAGTTSIFTCLQFLVRALVGAGGGNDLVAALGWKLAFSVVKQALALIGMFALLQRPGKRRAYALVGALVYGCAPWFLYRAVQFDFMTDAFALLPLVVLAYERYRDQKPGGAVALVLAMALLIATNLYFGYICCVFLATLFLVFSCEKGNNGRAYALRVLRLAGVCALGALLASAALLPSVNAILSSDRTVGDSAVTAASLLPSAQTLAGLFEQLFLGSGKLGLPLFCLLIPFAVQAGLDDDGKKRTVLALVWLVLLLLPITGSVMNGFSYETPRWQFVVIFAVACAVPDWLTALERCRIRPLMAIALCAILCALYACFGELSASAAGAAWLASFALSLCGLLLVAFGAKLAKGRLGRHWTVLLCASALACGVLNSVSVRVHNLYADSANEAFFGTEAAYRANAALVPEGGAFYRVHDRGIDVHDEDAEARPFVYGTYGVSSYASELSGAMSRWHKKTFCFRTTPVCAGIYQSFDDRLFHEIAWNVRYKVDDTARADDLASNWQSAGEAVYESALSTGFALWYDTAMDERDWLDYDVAHRDALLLQTAALSDGQASAYPAPAPDDVTRTLPLTLQDATMVGGVWENGLLAVPERATLTWQTGLAGAEGEYLLCCAIEETSDRDAFSITANGRTTDKFADSLRSESLNYPLREYAFHFDGNETALSLTLSAGVYRLGELQISFNGYEKLADWVAARNRCDFDTLSISGSRIDGTITVGQRGVLALSMQNHPGWRCLVDGEETQLLTVNGIFAGIALDPGVHGITLRYTPPYLVAGVILTLCTAMGLAVYAMIDRRRRR